MNGVVVRADSVVLYPKAFPMPPYVLCLGQKSARSRLLGQMRRRSVDAAAPETPEAVERLLVERGLPEMIVAESLDCLREAREACERLNLVPARVVRKRRRVSPLE